MFEITTFTSASPYDTDPFQLLCGKRILIDTICIN